MKFTPKKEADLNSFYVLEPGTYDFKVLKSFDKTSKAGNEMIELEIEVSSEGRKAKVYDYLLETTAYKLKHFCDSVGLEHEYATGTLVADMCVNKTGQCEIDIQKDKSGNYADKNVIKDYLKSDELPF